MLKGVLPLEELASGVVSLTEPTGIQRGLGAQNLVTAYCLQTHKNMHQCGQNYCRIKSMSTEINIITTSQIMVLQVTSKLQVFALKSQV